MNKWLYRPWSLGVTALLLILLDQVTKGLAVRFLKGQSPLVLWKGVFELRYLENRGRPLGCCRDSRYFF